MDARAGGGMLVESLGLVAGVTAGGLRRADILGCTGQAMDFSVLSVPSILQNAAILTIIVAFTGYAITFMSAHMLARRRDKLKLVNKRLNEFYGPLYVASEAGNIAYRSLLNRLGKEQSYPILDSELQEWVLWMRTIFIPLNEVRERIIIDKAHLIVEEKMPQCLLDFVTHVVGYKAVLAKWANGDYSERRSTIGWPPEFDAYVRESYAKLKAEQMRLMDGFGSRAWKRAVGRRQGVGNRE
jgi:hypothetical protein